MLSSYVLSLKTPLVATGELAQMVERLLSMQEALGSMPRFSNTFLYCSECMLNSKIYTKCLIVL